MLPSNIDYDKIWNIHIREFWFNEDCLTSFSEIHRLFIKFLSRYTWVLKLHLKIILFCVCIILEVTSGFETPSNIKASISRYQTKQIFLQKFQQMNCTDQDSPSHKSLPHTLTSTLQLQSWISVVLLRQWHVCSNLTPLFYYFKAVSKVWTIFHTH